MPRSIDLFGISFDTPTFPETVARITTAMRDATSGPGSCRFAFPVNVDVVVQIRANPALRQACSHADLVLIDGKPVVWIGRLFSKAIPGTVTGSDLVPALFDNATPDHPLKVFLLGAAPGVGEQAARRIESRWPLVKVTGTYSPPLGFERDASEQEHMVARVNESGADLLVIGLGAPKQELWIDAHRSKLATTYAICAGATIDFIAGAQRRAPEWMRGLGLEWLFRLVTNPRRLWRRYWRDFCALPALVWEESRHRSSAGPLPAPKPVDGSTPKLGPDK